MPRGSRRGAGPPAAIQAAIARDENTAHSGRSARYTLRMLKGSAKTQPDPRDRTCTAVNVPDSWPTSPGNSGRSQNLPSCGAHGDFHSQPWPRGHTLPLKAVNDSSVACHAEPDPIGSSADDQTTTTIDRSLLNQRIAQLPGIRAGHQACPRQLLVAVGTAAQPRAARASSSSPQRMSARFSSRSRIVHAEVGPVRRRTGASAPAACPLRFWRGADPAAFQHTPMRAVGAAVEAAAAAAVRSSPASPSAAAPGRLLPAEPRTRKAAKPVEPARGVSHNGTTCPE